MKLYMFTLINVATMRIFLVVSDKFIFVVGMCRPMSTTRNYSLKCIAKFCNYLCRLIVIFGLTIQIEGFKGK